MVIKNIFFAGLIQATNVIIPLIVFPYVISVVGAGNFGIISITITLTTILNLLVDYSFNVTAIKEIAESKSDKNKINQIFSEVLTLRAILGVSAILILISVPIFYDPFRTYYYTFFLGSTIIVGQILSPLWFYQGIEKFSVITILNLISRLMFLILTFTFIKEPKNFYLVPLFFGFGNIISGLAALLFIVLRYKVNYKVPQSRSLKLHLGKGLNIFTSSASTIIYMHINIIILSFFCPSSTVGLYSVAERIIVGIRQILGAFASVMYPRLCFVLNSNNKNLKQLLDIYKYFIVLILIGCILLFIISNFIISLFLKLSAEIEHVSLILKILCIVPFIVALNIPANQLLLAKEHFKSWKQLSILAVVICISLNMLLAYNFNEIGTVTTVIAVESFITLGLYLLLYKKEPLLFENLFFKLKDNEQRDQKLY